jgi:hypothetical protein
MNINLSRNPELRFKTLWKKSLGDTIHTVITSKTTVATGFIIHQKSNIMTPSAIVFGIIHSYKKLLNIK